MPSDEGNENGEKTTMCLTSKKSNFARVAQFVCTFLCRYFARLHRETSRNFLVTGVIEKISHVFMFIFFSVSLIFTLMAASISYFLTAATQFSC